MPSSQAISSYEELGEAESRMVVGYSADGWQEAGGFPLAGGEAGWMLLTELSHGREVSHQWRAIVQYLAIRRSCYILLKITS
jgi:hypothetical protein